MGGNLNSVVRMNKCILGVEIVGRPQIKAISFSGVLWVGFWVVVSSGERQVYVKRSLISFL